MHSAPLLPLGLTLRADLCLTLFLTLLLFQSACAAQDPFQTSTVPDTAHASDQLGPGENNDGPYPDHDSQAYEASFQGVSRDITGRAGVGLVGLLADTPQNLNILPGSTIYYSFQVKPTDQPQRRRDLQDVLEGKQPNDQRESVEGKEEVILEPSNTWNASKEESTAIAARQDSDDGAVNVYISINTCIQPSFKSSEDRQSPPQLLLSTLPIRAGQQFDDSIPTGFATTDLSEGYAGVTVKADGAVVVAVAAPEVSKSGSTDWNYDVAASLHGPYHAFDSSIPVYLKLIDSDPHAALLITDGLETWSKDQANKTYGSLAAGAPLDIFANNINYTALHGLTHSYCAQARFAQIQGSTGSNPFNGFEKGLTVAQPSKLTEEQFYLPGLNATSTYYGRLASLNASKYGNPATIGGGGVIYPTMNFTTKADENCAVVYNLSFCADVNYAVPANPSRYDRAQLTSLYDDQASKLYKNFSYSLQQIPCNTTPTAQYSLAVGCDDCAAAYKTWLCAVTIPKCMDFSTNFGVNTIPNSFLTSIADVSGSGLFKSMAENDDYDGDAANEQDNAVNDPNDPSTNKQSTRAYLMPRNLAQAPLLPPSSSSPQGGPPTHIPSHTNINSTLLTTLSTNSSRSNATIASLIQPGPYLEVLPCADLCYDLVRMCPAALGFGCPAPGSRLEALSYGRRGVGRGGAYTCNAPGAVYYPNGGRTLHVGGWMLGVAVVVGVWVAV